MMKNVFFYFATVLIWGSTWIGIKYQLGEVSPLVSVGYRFGLASLILLGWCGLKKLPMRFSLVEHLFMALQGIFLFGLNYLLFYHAELHITSGLAAVIFSTILLWNMINGALFLKSPLDQKVALGGTLGLIGIIFVFSPEITAYSLENSGVRGVIFCIAATYLASLGNILSARNQRSGLAIVQTNAYGMGYGALLMLTVAFITEQSFQLDTSPLYLLSLGYLAVFGSIIAFGCYLSLIGSIGADRAAYATLLFPLVALAISTMLEGYQWTFSALCGVVLILLGNILIMNRKKTALVQQQRQQLPAATFQPITPKGKRSNES